MYRFFFLRTAKYAQNLHFTVTPKCQKRIITHYGQIWHDTTHGVKL